MAQIENQNKHLINLLVVMQGIVIITVLLMNTSARASTQKLVLVMQRHSQFGLEQISLVRNKNAEIKVISNSGALNLGLPQKLGIMKIVDQAKINKRLTALLKRENSKALRFKKISHGHSSFEILFNGKEVDASSIDFANIKSILVEALKDAQIVQGAEIKSVADLKCTTKFIARKVCESEFGWVYPTE